MFRVCSQVVQLRRPQWNRNAKITYFDLRCKSGDRIAGATSPIPIQINANLSRRNSGRRNEHLIRSIVLGRTDARIRATQNDTSYQVLISPPGISPAQICIDLDGDGTCSTGDPVTTFAAQIKVSNLGVPVPLGPAQLNYLTTDTEHSNASGGGLTWNAMGLPCQRIPGAAACTAM